MPVTPIHEHAVENLRYIRETLERATEFTAVPGYGGIGMGLIALAAWRIAAQQTTPERWMVVWMAAAAAAAVVGGIAVHRKARRTGASLLSPVARKFATGFAPPLLAGGLITAALWRAGHYELMPGIWLTLYATAIIAGGAWSVRVVPMMGAAFLVLGAAALLGAPFQNELLAAGFGLVHLTAGAIIAWRHGG